MPLRKRATWTALMWMPLLAGPQNGDVMKVSSSVLWGQDSSAASSAWDESDIVLEHHWGDTAGKAARCWSSSRTGAAGADRRRSWHHPRAIEAHPFVARTHTVARVRGEVEAIASHRRCRCISNPACQIRAVAAGQGADASRTGNLSQRKA